MAVLRGVVGGGGWSRLFRILRGEKRYAFDVAASYTAPRFAGNWRVRAGVRTDSTADAVGAILAELQRVCDEPVPAAEMDEMKSAIVGQFALRLEQPLQVIGYSYTRFRFGFSSDYWDRYPEKIGAVSASEIQAGARKYMNPAVPQIA